MWDLLHCFGAGIAFAFGVCFGAILCQLASVKGREQFVADMKDERESVEQRLTEQCEHVLRIAIALENISELKLRDSSGR